MQSAWRGYKARKQVKELKAAIMIQVKLLVSQNSDNDRKPTKDIKCEWITARTARDY